MPAGEKARVLAESAFLTAMMVFLGVVGLSFPPLFFIVFLFIPLPLIIFVRRHHIKYSLPVLLVADAVILGLAPELSSAWVLIIYFNGLGLLYGLFFKNHIPAGRSIFVGACGASLLVLLAIFFVLATTGSNLFSLDQETRTLVLQSMETYRWAWALKGTSAEAQAELINKTVDIIELFIPGQLVVTVVASAVVTYLLAHRIFTRWHYQVTPIPSFSEMRFPWYTVWGLIAGLSLALLGDLLYVLWLSKAGKNLLFILFHVFLALGLSVAVYYYRRLSLAAWTRFLLFILAVFYFPISMAVLFLLGVVDTLVNLRSLSEEK
ncbi:MAG: DUF2232 domain-containing protein [Peptococcaceae bacterium]|nr:MAG: DUF2232 domain-containing protein [Peptococcaceae bacterium]